MSRIFLSYARDDDAPFVRRLPTQDEATAIVAQAAHVPVSDLTPEALDVIRKCGRLPLALRLCGSMARTNSWSDILLRLERRKLANIADRHAAETQHIDLDTVLAVSVDALTKEQQDRFAELAVFAFTSQIQQSAVETLWEGTGKLDDIETSDLITLLIELSLLDLDSKSGESRAVSMHDLVRVFVEGRATRSYGSLPKLHAALLDAYHAKCSERGWPDGPNDGYLFDTLCRHLVEAERVDEAVSLLTSQDWIEANCRIKRVFDLLDDYRVVKAAMPEAQEELRTEREREERLNRWTNEISAYASAWTERRKRIAKNIPLEDPEPLLPEPPQTVRIWTDDEIRQNTERIINNPTRLDRLTAFSGFVKSELYALLAFVDMVSFVRQQARNSADRGPVSESAELDGSRSGPFLARMNRPKFNPYPACIATLAGHTSSLGSVAVTPDGKRAVTDSGDNTLRVWDLESGRRIATLEGHTDWVSSVAVIPGGQRAVSGSRDNTLRVWDLESGRIMVVASLSGPVTVAAPTGINGFAAGLSNGEVHFYILENVNSGPAILTLLNPHSVRCTLCGREYEPSPEIVTAVRAKDKAILRAIGLSCTHCAQPVVYNPFFGDPACV